MKMGMGMTTNAPYIAHELERKGIAVVCEEAFDIVLKSDVPKLLTRSANLDSVEVAITIIGHSGSHTESSEIIKAMVTLRKYVSIDDIYDKVLNKLSEII